MTVKESTVPAARTLEILGSDCPTSQMSTLVGSTSDLDEPVVVEMEVGPPNPVVVGWSMAPEEFTTPSPVPFPSPSPTLDELMEQHMVIHTEEEQQEAPNAVGASSSSSSTAQPLQAVGASSSPSSTTQPPQDLQGSPARVRIVGKQHGAGRYEDHDAPGHSNDFG